MTVPRRAAAVEYTLDDATGEVRNLGYRAIDGATGRGLLAPAGPPETATLLLYVHGSNATAEDAPVRPLLTDLAARGLPGLAVTTRMHHGQDADFFAVGHDVDAAYRIALDLGYRSIVLVGHSIGATHTCHYAATQWAPELAGLILLAGFPSSSWRTRYRLIDDEEAYAELAAASAEAVAGGTGGLLKPGMPFLGRAPVPVTARHFLTYRAEETSSAEAAFWIRRVPRPILIVHDGADRTVPAHESTWLYAAATRPGSLAPSVTHRLLPAAGERNGHAFADNLGPVRDAVLEWLAGPARPSERKN